MDRFSQAALSPVMEARRPRPLPYGLTASDLLPILADAPANIASLECFTAYRTQGLHGEQNSCAVTLGYRADDGVRNERTVFVKRTMDAASREADHYRLLAGHGVATPQLLAAIERDGTEVMVLEFLPLIGIDFSDRAQVDDLLRLIARLNSIPAGQYCDGAAPGSASPAFDATVEAAFKELVAGGLATAREVKVWFGVYRCAQDELPALRTAFTHGELYFQQVGVRSEPFSEVVLFDLATLQLRPRFFDIAGVLTPLADAAGISDRAAFATYLDALRPQPAGLTADDAWRELHTVRFVSTCWSLPWRLRSQEDGANALDLPDLDQLVRELRHDAHQLA